MEYMVVSGALIVVILLLVLVVYESSTLLQGFVGRLRRIVKRGKHESSTLLRGFAGRLGRIVKWRKKDDAADEEYPITASIDAGENAVDESALPDPLEAALDRISRLEEEATEISERTQGVSEDMKDVVGALRISIDGLTSRLDQVDGAMEDIHLTLEPLPQNVLDAIDSIREVSNRVESISADLQRTLGYAIQKIFKCQSCGSEGLVANQVLCSNCGNESWWGWWPSNDDLVKKEEETGGNPVEEIEG